MERAFGLLLSFWFNWDADWIFVTERIIFMKPAFDLFYGIFSDTDLHEIIAVVQLRLASFSVQLNWLDVHDRFSI